MLNLFLILEILLFGINSIHCSTDDVKFFIYNTKNQYEGTQLKIDDTKTFKKFDSKKQTRIFVHGWRTSSTSYESIVVRDAYIRKGNLNVIIADWQKARSLNYLTVVSSINETATEVSNLIKFLVSKRKANYSDIYLIGHSLGVHVSGMTGKLLKPNKVDTLIALDAARPGFTMINLEPRIDKNDAEYVQAIHSDAGFVGAGLRENFGDADFFPNGGRYHPHCVGSDSPSCDHTAAVDFFAESINSEKGFYGILCEGDRVAAKVCGCHEKCSQARMGGEPVTKNAKGVYYLATNHEVPYARGKY